MKRKRRGTVRRLLHGRGRAGVLSSYFPAAGGTARRAQCKVLGEGKRSGSGLRPGARRARADGELKSSAGRGSSSGVGMGDGGVRGCKSAWCGRFGARRRGVPDAASFGASARGRRSGKGEREGKRERARRRSQTAQARHVKGFRIGKTRSGHTFSPAFAADRKKALPESRQGLFDASETEITPCLRQCSRRCGRFPVLHRWE